MKDKYRIERTGKAEWTISRLIPKGTIASRGRTAGKPTEADRWEDFAYYPNLKSAATRLLDSLVGDELESGRNICAAIEAAEARVVQAIEKISEGKSSATV